MRPALAAALLAGALLLASCGVKSDPAWPGGVWGDAPSPQGAPAAAKAPADRSTDKPAPAGTAPGTP